MVTEREARLNQTFVTLADTLTDDYDVVSLLQTLITESSEILDTAEGGIMLSDGDGHLELIASTSERAELVELMQLSAGAGPCVDAFRTGTAISIADIAVDAARWPAFSELALAQGLHAIHAVPLRLRREVIGTMNLFGAAVGPLTDDDAAVAQALADVATIGILHQRLAAQSRIVTEQLQRALDSRVVIEQAKGAIAQSTGLSMDDAFAALRAHARSRSLPLHSVADAIVRRSLSPEELLGR